MIDISQIEKLKKKLEALKKTRAAMDIDIAKKEAIISDTMEKLKTEYGVTTIEDGRDVLVSLKAKAESLEAEITSRLNDAARLLGDMP
jgi:hypothetical protein